MIDPLIFPYDCLLALEGSVFTDNWSIPYKKDGMPLFFLVQLKIQMISLLLISKFLKRVVGPIVELNNSIVARGNSRFGFEL